MAAYKCLNCGHDIDFGFIPPVTCGFCLLPPLLSGSVATSVALAITKHYSRWYAILVSVLVFFGTVYLTFMYPFVLERLCLHLHRCQNCGRRKWSQAFFRGFGL